MKKPMSAICVLLVAITLLSSCEKSTGIEIGFSGKWFGRLPQVHFGIKSDKTEFDIDDVTLDFSYGNGSVSDVGGYIGVYNEETGNTEDWPIVSMAVYFYNAKYRNTREPRFFEDYKSIEGLYFVKEIGIDDYNENYDVKNNIFGSKYEHTETLTIPKETFELTTGFVCIGVYEIAYNSSKNTYCFAGGSNKGLKYEMLDGGKVKISEPGTTVYRDPE